MTIVNDRIDRMLSTLSRPVLSSKKLAVDAEKRLRALLDGSFDIHEAVRAATAGKGYTAAPAWTRCGSCAQPVSSRESVAIVAGVVHHELCHWPEAGTANTNAPSPEQLGRSHCPVCEARLNKHETLGYVRDAQGNITAFCCVGCKPALLSSLAERL